MLKWQMDDRGGERADSLWWHAGSNLVLDVHGDPVNAQLTIFSDGNHHMALAECVQLMQNNIPGLEDILYLTMPPPVLRRLLDHPRLVLGNLKIPLQAHIIISPLPVLVNLCETRRCRDPKPFAAHKGCALLVAKSNPKKITSYSDVIRNDVCLFLSNPDTEWVSHALYRDYLNAQFSKDQQEMLQSRIESRNGVLIGESIHHREAPQALANGQCDVAILYRHLAAYYQKQYPEQFDLVLPKKANPLPSTPQPYAAALVEGGAGFGRQALEILLSSDCKAIYESHGLIAL